MNRGSLQEISRLRQKEAQVLLKAGHYAGAYYLAGYAVECALKACIAKQTQRHDFPDKKLGNNAWVHDLEKLLGLAGLRPELDRAVKNNRALDLNWTLVTDWSEDARYESNISQFDAQALCTACSARNNGILSWIKKRW